MIAVVIHNTWDWEAIPRAMLAFAIGLITMGLGHWAQLALHHGSKIVDYCPVIMTFYGQFW